MIKLIMLSLFLLSCGKNSKFKDSNGSDNENYSVIESEGVSENKNEDTVNIQLAQVDLGMRNYMQIYISFSILTGVPISNEKVNVAFEAVKDQLPSSNNLKTFSSSSQVAIVKLASAFCDVLIDDASLRDDKLKGFNFNGNVSTSLNDSGKEMLISGLTRSFWTETMSSADINEDKKELLLLLNDLIKNFENEDIKQTIAISKGVCAAALSSSSMVFM